MTYEHPPHCGTCGHLAEVHEDWWKPKPKGCVTHADGVRCDCRAYVRSET
jgi:hypothetical protein